MKIGILTFHYSVNQGSALQAYCVQNMLHELFPQAKIEVIDIIPFDREKNELRFYTRNFPFFSIQKFRKYRSIRRFVKKYLNLTKRVYFNNIEKQIDFINKQNYDLICTGSDTVWVDTFTLGNKIPNIYFLPEKINSNKISIAASVDPLNNIDKYLHQKDQLRSIFNSYKFITVRDMATKSLVEKLTDNKVEMIADPTILFDFETKLNINKQKVWNPGSRRRIALAVMNRCINSYLKDELSSIGNAFDALFNRSSDFDYIFDELNSYQGYDIIVTDRFHRSIFALKLSSALLIYVERQDRNIEPNSKGRRLFEDIGVPQYVIRYEIGKNDELVNQIKNIVSIWNYDLFVEREKKFNSFLESSKNRWSQVSSEIKAKLSD